MANITTPLFQGQRIYLGSIDYEKDPEVESRWTHDPDYMRMLHTKPMRPLSTFQVKKKYEALEKEADDDKNLFHFRIRAVEDDRLIGFAEIRWIAWSHSVGALRLGIGHPDDRGKGLGAEALALLMRYAFYEANLYRIGTAIPEYNEAALKLFAKAGFTQEVRRREALMRDGRRWDMIHVGMLRDEWKEG